MAEVNKTAEKEYSLDDVMNFLITMNDDINKRFDESDKKWDQLLRKPKTDQLKENKEVELKQVSDNNVVNNSEGIINKVSNNDNSNNE